MRAITTGSAQASPQDRGQPGGLIEDGIPAFTSVVAFVIPSGESNPARTAITVAGLAPVGTPICKGARS